MNNEYDYLTKALLLAAEHSRGGHNGPFGALIVSPQGVLAQGWNRVVELHDPTAHAEVCAIRSACQTLSAHDLPDCILYSSCEPCPMCLSAIYWARIRTVYYAATAHQAAAAGFDDEFIYAELGKEHNAKQITLRHIDHAQATEPFELWINNPNRQHY
ncbi:MAG: nucleoside deaminase [Chitinivibrionales bacterium]|nr:nucleoside deaminase [Chitinivibrionales bacterium]